ncbi:MAG: hypothetical protein QME81_14710, partial [bacterium]|nr:hypothetical protein [bacterium]
MALTENYAAVFGEMEGYFTGWIEYLSSKGNSAAQKRSQIDAYTYKYQFDPPEDGELILAIKEQAGVLSAANAEKLANQRQNAIISLFPPDSPDKPKSIAEMVTDPDWKYQCQIKGEELWHHLPASGLGQIARLAAEEARDTFTPQYQKARYSFVTSWASFTGKVDEVYERKARMYEILYDLYDQLSLSATAFPSEISETSVEKRWKVRRGASPVVKVGDLLTPKDYFRYHRNSIGVYLRVPRILSYTGQSHSRLLLPGLTWANVTLDWKAQHPAGIVDYAYRITKLSSGPKKSSLSPGESSPGTRKSSLSPKKSGPKMSGGWSNISSLAARAPRILSYTGQSLSRLLPGLTRANAALNREARPPAGIVYWAKTSSPVPTKSSPVPQKSDSDLTKPVLGSPLPPSTLTPFSSATLPTWTPAWRSTGQSKGAHFCLLEVADPAGQYEIYLRARAPSGYAIIRKGMLEVGYPSTNPDAPYAGYTEVKKSLNITDLTPPTRPVVEDEGEFTTRSKMLYATWRASDPESDISEYQYRISEQSGPLQTDIVVAPSQTGPAVLPQTSIQVVPSQPGPAVPSQTSIQVAPSQPGPAVPSQTSIQVAP